MKDAEGYVSGGGFRTAPVRPARPSTLEIITSLHVMHNANREIIARYPAVSSGPSGCPFLGFQGDQTRHMIELVVIE